MKYHHGRRAAAGDEIQLVASNTFFSTISTNNLTMNVPSGTLDGDLMIAFLTKSGGSDTYTQPSGWNEVIDVGLTGRSFMVAWRKANNEPSTYTWTTVFTGQNKYGVIATFRGADIDYDSGAGAAFNSNTTAPSITVSQNRSWQLFIGRATDASITISITGTTTITIDDDATVPSTLFAYKRVSAGSTGTTSTTNGGSNVITATLAINPS